MKKPANGMQMFHEQVNDRQRWHEAMMRRENIIAELDGLNWRLESDPRQMKIADLEKSLEKAKSHAFYAREQEKNGWRRKRK